MEPDPRPGRVRPFVFTVVMWFAAVAVVVVAGLVATEFVLMATSLDPSDMIAAGVEPWRDAAIATGAFAGVSIVTIFSLWLWHSARPWPVAVVLMALEVVAVAWVCMRVIDEYF